MTIRHDDPDTQLRAFRLERERVNAEETLWIITGSGSGYDWRRRRAGRIAAETGIPIHTAILDEIARVKLDWTQPSGVGAACRIEDRRRHEYRESIV